MDTSRRMGTVLWYDNLRGYGFVDSGHPCGPVFITETEVVDFGMCGLRRGARIVFNIDEGRASARVKTIKGIRGLQ